MSITSLISILELHQPLWLLLILVPPITSLYQKIAANNLLPASYFDPKMHYWYINHNQSDKASKKISTLLNYLFWIMFAITMAGPEYAKTINNEIDHQGDTLLILLDVSASMNARDELPSRLLRAKSEIMLLVDKLKTGDKLGVMLFAGTAHLLFPPTNDKLAMEFYIQKIKPNMLPIAGSELDEALKLSEQLLTSINKDRNNHVLLISDGDIDDTDIMFKKIESLNYKLPVYTLGIGKYLDTPVPSASGDQLWLQTINGITVTSNLNDVFLKKISQLTDAKYHALSNTEKDIDFLYVTGIKADTYSEKDTGNTNWIQLYHLFLLIALLIFFYKRILNS